MITAEVIPVPNKRAQAATALQRAGFRVLAVGESITISAETNLFESFFGIRLIKQRKQVVRGLPESAGKEFFRPEKLPIIPREFASLIKDVVFPEPPEYF